jgi:hypothetical protein
MSATEQLTAILRGGASRRGRQVGATLTALICVIVLAGCKPSTNPAPTLTVVRSEQAIEGGSCGLVFDASGLQHGTTYGLGMYTTGSPLTLGYVTSNAAGSITGGRVHYPSLDSPLRYPNAVAELYTDSSGQLGVGVAQAKVTIAFCLPTGLAP